MNNRTLPVIIDHSIFIKFGVNLENPNPSK